MAWKAEVPKGYRFDPKTSGFPVKGGCICASVVIVEEQPGLFFYYHFNGNGELLADEVYFSFEEAKEIAWEEYHIDPISWLECSTPVWGQQDCDL